MDASICMVIAIPVVALVLFVFWVAAELAAGKAVRIAVGVLCFATLMLGTCLGFRGAFFWQFKAMTAWDTMHIVQDHLEAGEIAEAQDVLNNFHLASRGR